MRFKNRILAAFLGLALVSMGLTIAYLHRKNKNLTSTPAVAPAIVEVEPNYPHRVKRNSSFYTTLRELDIESVVIHNIVAATKPILNLGRLQSGTEFRLVRGANNELTGLEFRLSATEKVLIDKRDDQWRAERLLETVETKTATFAGVVQSTLWESAEAAQMDPDLIIQLAEIFAWEVDFAREVRRNDRWRISVEQRLVKGRPIGWGQILAAEYENSGDLHTAVLFKDGDHSAYYSADGSNLRRMFLKSPLKFGRISSRFNLRRFHPIHKIRRPHRGVDYAAPTGTPIRAVGDGVITMARWSGEGGNTIRIRHNATYQTAYLHLSRFNQGIRNGTRVQQGQIIGFVGSTGASTGPHLHFEFYNNGRVVDPLKQKFPSADPISKDNLEKFQSHAKLAFATLPSWNKLNTPVRTPSQIPLMEALSPREAQADTPSKR